MVPAGRLRDTAWHTPYNFTLDFWSLLVVDADESDVVPCRLVARVKLPVTLLYDAMRALNTE